MSSSHSDAVPTAPAAASPIARSSLWLLGIVAVGLVLRGWNLTAPFQVEEFAEAAAVVERQGVPAGFTAAESDPLAPVASASEVAQRSVIPYGINDPLPLYHYLLYGVVKALPPADWSLRLPSLLAGLGCIVVVYLMAKRLLGAEVALIAAGLVALDPVSVSISGQARPFALATFSCLLSFAALVSVLQARSTGIAALCALGYTLALAFAAYLVPATLFAAVAHLGIAGYMLVRGTAPARAAFAAVGLLLALALLWPVYGYWGQLFAWGRDHTDYLERLQPTRLRHFLMHNLVLLGGMVLVVVGAAVVRWQVQGEDAADSGDKGGDKASSPERGGGTAVAVKPTTAPATAKVDTAPLPENEDAVWLARLWVFLPQLAVLVAAQVTGLSIFRTGFLGYTALGAALLLAYIATRDPSREVRLGIVGVLAVALLVLNYFSEFSLVGLSSNNNARRILNSLALVDDNWKEGDAVLLRAGLPESDFLATDIPEATREEVKRALRAPLTTLYADTRRRPLELLTLSHYRGDKIALGAGNKCKEHLDRYYDTAFAKQLKRYERYRITGFVPMGQGIELHECVQPAYLACLVPWLADIRGSDMTLSRARDQSDPNRYLVVPAGLRVEDEVEGLTAGDRKDIDYMRPLHLIRPRLPDDPKPAEKKK